MKRETRSDLIAMNARLLANGAQAVRERDAALKDAQNHKEEATRLFAEVQRLRERDRATLVRLGEPRGPVTDTDASIEEIVAAVHAINLMGWLPVAVLDWPFVGAGERAKPFLRIVAREILK